MIPYEWNGHIYHGIKAVAQAAGVCPTTVSCHLLRHGHLDNLGIGRGKRAPRNMVWHDKTYPSVKSVAEAAGVCPATVSVHLSRHGHLDNLGIGRGRRPPRTLVWQGKTYTSVKDVAKAAGVSQGYVYRLLSVWNGLDKLADRRRSGEATQSCTSAYGSTTSPSTGVQEGATA